MAALPLHHLAGPALDNGLHPGPQDATSTIVYHAVRKGYREQDMGYGSAISLIFFIAVLLISLIQRRLTREKD